MSGAVRIVDMPDLGAVTDSSSLVGENAGSGRFTAFALRSYVNGSSNVYHSIANVLDYGAKGDGTTDDTAAIQAILNGAAGKATVLIPNTGSPFIVAPLTVPSGTDLLIYGTLLLKAGSASTIIGVNNVSHVTIRGNGVVDGNASNAASGAAGINIANSSNVIVSGITVQNALLWNLAASASHNVWFDKVSMIGGSSANGFAAGSYNCWATGCYINGPAGDEGFSFYGDVYNCGAIGNTMTNAGDAGISILNDAGQPAPCRDIIISNNIVYGCLYGGISVAQGTGGTGSHWGVTIANNRLYNNNLSNASWCPQITVQAVGCVVVSGNLISDDDTNAIAAMHACSHGIWLDSTAASVTITGNSVFNIGSSARPGIGLFVNSANGVNATGNMFADFRGTAYMTTAIGGSAGADNAYTNNVVDIAGGVISFTGIQPDTAIFNSGSGHALSFGQAPPLNFANDAAAATGGVPLGGMYRNGSVLQVRVA